MYYNRDLQLILDAEKSAGFVNGLMAAAKTMNEVAGSAFVEEQDEKAVIIRGLAKTLMSHAILSKADHEKCYAESQPKAYKEVTDELAKIFSLPSSETIEAYEKRLEEYRTKNDELFTKSMELSKRIVELMEKITELEVAARAKEQYAHVLAPLS